MADIIVSTIAEGLDEVVDGDGWGPKHQAAGNYANAAPLLLAACRAVAALPGESPARDLCLCAIALAEGGPKPVAPAITTTLEQLQVLIKQTLSSELEELDEASPPKAPEYIRARVELSASAVSDLAELLA